MYPRTLNPQDSHIYSRMTLPISIRLRRSRTSEMTPFCYKYAIPAELDCKAILSDLWGNRLSIDEPNAGIITCTYNKFNELITQTDANGNTTNYQYDLLGRVTQKQFLRANSQPQTFYYDYNLTPKGKGKLYQTRINGMISAENPVATTQDFGYYDNGNIDFNTQVGVYSYLGNKPHAVTQIEPTNETVFSPDNCAVTYNFFNQPTLIKEGAHQLELFYGADQQRNKALKRINGTLEYTHYYISKHYEKNIDALAGNFTRHCHYIYGDNDVVALHVASQGKDHMYYIHTDHLGSYIAITGADKQVRERNWFDPWGNMLLYEFRGGGDPSRHDTGTYVLGKSLTYRGFTGHEHYPEFKIINMNGRLYDPVIGRFFSPDNFVQAPEFSQGFNRYSYCLNNPLMLKDPTGQRYSELDNYVDDDYTLDKRGQIRLLKATFDDFDRLIALDENGKQTDKQMIVRDRNILPDLAKHRKGFDGTNYAVSGSPETGDVFLFAAQNSNVEWGLDGFKNNGKNEYVVYTDHTNEIKISARGWHMFKDKPILFEIHSHPTNSMNYRMASGFGKDYYGDMATIKNYYDLTGKVPDNYIYHPYSESLIKYTPWNPQSKIQTNIKYPGGLLFLYK